MNSHEHEKLRLTPTKVDSKLTLPRDNLTPTEPTRCFKIREAIATIFYRAATKTQKPAKRYLDTCTSSSDPFLRDFFDFTLLEHDMLTLPWSSGVHLVNSVIALHERRPGRTLQMPGSIEPY
jgi:hypothetical protein